MQIILTMLVSALPNAFIRVFGMILTEKFLSSVLEKVIVLSARKAASLSTNTLDDELVNEIEERFKDGEK